MELGVLLALLGFGAILALGDFFSSSSSSSDEDQPDDDPPEDDTIRRGTAGDDVMISAGGEILMGLEGDDTLITFGDSTLLGGEGDDILVSVGGGALLSGGEGADTFVIELMPLGDEGRLQDIDGEPVAPTVIDDFNPDEDRLVIDLRGSDIAARFGDPLELTGELAPDGEGLLIRIMGLGVVQLSSYGGEDMQAALEALVEDFDALTVIGATVIFPEVPPELPPGIEQREPSESDLWSGLETRLVVTEGFEGGGEIAGRLLFNPVLDLSEYSGNASVIQTDEGLIFLQIDGTDLEPTLLTDVNRVILGPGDNTVSVGSVPGGFEVIASEGVNDISAWRGTLSVSLLGGTNTVYLADEGRLNLRIAGGENTVRADDFVGVNVTMLEGVAGTTEIDGGDIGDLLRFVGSEPDLTVALTPSGGLSATWAAGSLDLGRAWAVRLEDGVTVDASALDPTIPFGTIFATGPDATVIGGDAPLSVAGQGQFLGGAGDDLFEVVVASDGGALVNGGGGENTFVVDFSAAFAGDVVVMGGEGPNRFFAEFGVFWRTDAAGVLRITDFADDDRLTLDLFGVDSSSGPLESQLAIIEDVGANQVEIRVNDLTLVILENRATLPDGALRVFDNT